MTEFIKGMTSKRGTGISLANGYWVDGVNTGEPVVADGYWQNNELTMVPNGYWQGGIIVPSYASVLSPSFSYDIVGLDLSSSPSVTVLTYASELDEWEE